CKRHESFGKARGGAQYLLGRVHGKQSACTEVEDQLYAPFRGRKLTQVRVLAKFLKSPEQHLVVGQAPRHFHACQSGSKPGIQSSVAQRERLKPRGQPNPAIVAPEVDRKRLGKSED